MADHYYTPDVISKLQMRKLKLWDYRSHSQGRTDNRSGPRSECPQILNLCYTAF